MSPDEDRAYAVERFEEARRVMDVIARNVSTEHPASPVAEALGALTEAVIGLGFAVLSTSDADEDTLL